MKILIVTVGSRGDIAPCIALANSLRNKNHDVAIATHEEYRNQIEKLEFSFHKIWGNPRSYIRSLSKGGKSHFRYSIKIYQFLRSHYSNMLNDVTNIDESFDLVLDSGMQLGNIRAFIEKVPSTQMSLVPIFIDTQCYPHPYYPDISKTYGWWNNYTHFMCQLSEKVLYRKVFDQSLESISGLANVTMAEICAAQHSRHLTLLTCSKHLLSDIAGQSTKITGTMTGFWFPASNGTQLEKNLDEFLSNGEKPIYLGFGSMKTNRADRLLKKMVAAISELGLRAVIATGWSNAVNPVVSKNILLIESAPHEHLLPRVSLAIHHGGAGTTAATLRAGIPSIIVPHFTDQFFWGSLVERNGVGGKPIYVKRLTARKLKRQIVDTLSNKEIIASAAEMGKKIRAENGVEVACEMIEAHFQQCTRDK